MVPPPGTVGKVKRQSISEDPQYTTWTMGNFFPQHLVCYQTGGGGEVVTLKPNPLENFLKQFGHGISMSDHQLMEKNVFKNGPQKVRFLAITFKPFIRLTWGFHHCSYSNFRHF